MATAALARQENTMDRLLQVALENQAGMEVIERLSDLRRREMGDIAEAAFNEAMHRAQQAMRRIGTDAMNPQTHSKYATYAKLDAVLRPIYTGQGFSLSFNTEPIENPDTQRIVCYVSHKDAELPVGHTRTYRIDMPADGKGAKGNDVMTKTHATGAAASYGMRYLLKMIFNVAVGETDDDGNLNSAEPMDEKTFASHMEKIQGAATEDDLKKAFFTATKEARERGDKNAVASFEKAKNEAWRSNGGYR